MQAEEDGGHETHGEQAAGEDRDLDDTARRIECHRRGHHGKGGDADPGVRDDRAVLTAAAAQEIPGCHGCRHQQHAVQRRHGGGEDGDDEEVAHQRRDHPWDR